MFRKGGFCVCTCTQSDCGGRRVSSGCTTNCVIDYFHADDSCLDA